MYNTISNNFAHLYVPDLGSYRISWRGDFRQCPSLYLFPNIIPLIQNKLWFLGRYGKLYLYVLELRYFNKFANTSDALIIDRFM